MEKLILYGGAFDPIHNGHLRIALEASKLLDADLLFIPTKKPRWKETLTSDEDRLNMLKIALGSMDNPRFGISDIEMLREDKETYTSETIRALKEIHPEKELILLIGGDQVSLFSHWHEAHYIASNAKIYYVEREGFVDSEHNIERYDMKKLSLLDAGKVSSTSIRELSYIDTPVEVLSYIEEHSLYFVEKLKSFLKEKRLRHSLSVAKLSYEIALANKLENPGRAYIAGALHDIGKEIPEEAGYNLMDSLREYPRWSQHQYLGAYLAKEEFHILDEDILSAIRSHCTGKAEMNDLAMIVYAADKIDPLRGWDSSSFISLCKEDFKKGFLAVLKANREFLMKKNNGNADSISASAECFEYYLGGND